MITRWIREGKTVAVGRLRIKRYSVSPAQRVQQDGQADEIRRLKAELRRVSEEPAGVAASVYVSPKKGILDPAGQATHGALKSLGYVEVADVRIGKYITLRLEGVEGERARERVEEMCERLLANPIIDDYRVEIE